MWNAFRNEKATKTEPAGRALIRSDVALFGTLRPARVASAKIARQNGGANSMEPAIIGAWDRWVVFQWG